MSSSPPESGDPFFTNNPSQYPVTYPYHQPAWQQSSQASSGPPHSLYDTISHVEATTGPDVRVHPLSSQRTSVYESRAYGDPRRLALPMEPRPPAHIGASMSSSSHRESTTQMHSPAPMVVIPDHASAQREWSNHPTSGRPSHRGISAPAVGTMSAGSPSSTYSPSVSTSPSNPYNTPHAELAPYAMPTRSSSADVYRDTSQNAALRPGAWRSVTGSASETAPTESFSPSPVDDRSPRWHQGHFDEQNTANDYPSGGDSSPSNASRSASESDSSPTQYSSISMVSHRCSPTSNSPTRTLRKNKMHTCKVCQKQFPRPSGLTTHMNTHTGDRPHRCEEPGCDKRFTVLSNMRRHMRCHGYERPSEPNSGLSSMGFEFEKPVVAEDHQIAGGIPPLLRWVSSQSGPTTRQSDDLAASGHESRSRSETSPSDGPSSGVHPAGPSSAKLEEHDYLYQRPRQQ